VDFESSDLPIIIINTEGREIVDEPKVMARMSIINNGEGNRNHVTDPPNEYEGYIGIEYRGKSSAHWPKKPYNIETRTDSGENRNVSLFGMPKENDWILYAPYVDKTLIRNVFMYHLGSMLAPYAPRTQYIELVLNDEYMGIFVFTEKIKKDKGRVNISKPTEENITGGYLLEMIPNFLLEDDETHFKLEESGKEIVVKYPKPTKITSEELEYISTYFNELEYALNSPSFTDETEGYAPFIDIPSFINQMLLSEAFNQLDAFCQSTWFYKDKNEKLHLGPGWDYNRSMGNAEYFNSWRTDVWLLKEVYQTDPDGWHRINWPERFMEDTAFMERYGARWRELRSSLFSLGHLYGLIDRFSTEVEESRVRNFERWDVLGKSINNKYVFDTYEEEIAYMKDWILQKFTWLDEQFGLIRNDALRATVRVSAAENERPATNAVDGNHQSHWSAQTFPQWLEVDLGSVKEIDKTVIFPYKERAYQYVIEIKNDPDENYTLLVDRRDNRYPRLQFVDTFPRTEARFVRLTVNGAGNYDGNWCSINEFKVLASGNVTSTGGRKSPEGLLLVQNYPNPFRKITIISYTLPKSGIVALNVYNLHGVEVASLVEGVQLAGSHTVRFDASSLSEGIYFYRIIMNEKSRMKKMIIIR
jgi:spore coat protein CotH